MSLPPNHGANDLNDFDWEYPVGAGEDPGRDVEPGYPFRESFQSMRDASIEPGYPVAWAVDDPYPMMELEYPVGNREGIEAESPSFRDDAGAGMRKGSERRNSAARPPAPAQPLRVLCVGPTFQVGGVRQHALALAKFLDPARARITGFVVTDRDQSARRAPSMPAPVTFADSAELGRLAKDCDVLLMWGDGFNGSLQCDHPLRIFLAHGENWWTRNALEASSRVVDHVIAVSERVRRSVCNGFSTTAILNGVDTARLGRTASREAVRRRFAFRKRDFIVGSVGRLTREKQFDVLIEALARLPERFKLLLIGSGRRQSELLDHANRRIPGRFAVVPASDYLGDYYCAMDAFAMVSAHEGFGLVLAEAMMCGRPVVSTRVGCAPEVIQNRIHGLLVDHGPDAIAAALGLLEEHPAWARGMAREGRRFAARHLHASRMAQDYEDLMLRLHHQRTQLRSAGR
jgi:glycosyltransferase involved in cell wall biosynthesis